MSFATLAAHVANEVKRVIRWAAPHGSGCICLVLDPTLSPAISRLIDIPTMESLRVAEILELGGVRGLIALT
jgi:hypothetical protein